MKDSEDRKQHQGQMSSLDGWMAGPAKSLTANSSSLSFAT
jgi:hypothetical protein